MELYDEKKISLLVLKSWGGRSSCIIYCRPFKITKATAVCLAKRGQDQHLKLDPWHHILFYKVFFDGKHGKPPRLLARNSNWIFMHLIL